MPFTPTRRPWISIVSPSMTEATPAIDAGPGPGPVQFGKLSSGMRSLCCMTNCATKAAIAATVTKISRFGMAANWRARRSLALVRLRHWAGRLSCRYLSKPHSPMRGCGYFGLESRSACRGLSIRC